jgi:flavin-dependent dehydrogenase
VAMAAPPRDGDIIIVRLAGGWFWLIPLTKEKTSVGLVLDQAEFKASGLTASQLFDQAVAKHAAVTSKMQNASLVGKHHVLADFSYINREFVNHRIVRVGDAAGFLDPIFSSGVYLAMTSGRDAAKVVAEALERRLTLTFSMHKYEKELRREMKLYWRLIQGFYTDSFIELFMSPDPPFNLRSAVNSVLVGRLNQSWSIRWRLWLFYICVWVQKRVALGPRINWKET